MEKLLHEKLREWSDTESRFYYPTNKAGESLSIGMVDTPEDESLMFTMFADEIERYYIPRPRFEDGEPVQFGDEPDFLEVVDEISFFADGSVTIGHDGNTFVVDGFVKRPEYENDANDLKNLLDDMKFFDEAAVKAGIKNTSPLDGWIARLAEIVEKNQQ